MQVVTDWRERRRAWVRLWAGISLALDPRVKAALIVSMALLASVVLYLYFSPFHSCVRELTAARDDASAAWACARAVGGK